MNSNPIREESREIDTELPDSPPTRRRLLRPSVVVPAAIALVLVIAAVLLASQSWTAPHLSPLAVAILTIQIMDGPVPVIVYTLAALSIIVLIARRPSRFTVVSAAIGILAGAAIAFVVLWQVRSDDTFGVYVGKTISLFVAASLSAAGLAVASFWRSAWWRKIVAAFAIVLAVASATVGINAWFGLDPTVGDLLGINADSGIHLPPAAGDPASGPTHTGGNGSAAPLWTAWVPPVGMPSWGKVGSVIIPGTLSGFTARPAEVYLPPAALVANAPRLPLVIFMMGQPGNPDATFAGKILDQFAAKNHGLAPIVLAADQIGSPGNDTLCQNTALYGNSETYISKDVVNWARRHLHVLQDPAHWTVAGYSNGGECAAYFGAKYPLTWGNVLDISGEGYAGSEEPTVTVNRYFHGDWHAYERTWPVTILGTKRYPDSWGVFTVSSDDALFRLQATAVARAAGAAGWKSTFFEVPDGGHGAAALTGGLTEGFRVLFPRWGLSGK